jgi:U32 family peptidase
MKTKRQKPELMAPAGGPAAAFAAFAHGADAVYLGLSRFSARADAENFGPDELEAVIAFARAQTPRRRVYAAVNTLILERELTDAADQLGLLADLGADAVIVQDLGVARLAKRHFPSLRLHASTQMAVHNREGVEALRGLGFARVTLARELTLDEIRDIAAVPGIEVEAFVHGALCYCYSGLCLFSSLATGRSGNRGRCAYLCRDRFASPGRPADDGRFVFSMKDLALPDAVAALREAGVASLKIEGRKKNALYVAAVSSFYRRLIDGGLSAADRAAAEADLQAIFSRPWTGLFSASRHAADVVDPEAVGPRGTPVGRVEKVVAGPGGARRLRFRTARALQVHDGLQVDVPGGDRPFGFAVDRLLLSGREVFEAPAHAEIEVELPPDAPVLPVGAAVSCASSQAVKQAYRVDVPPLNRLRVRRPLKVRLEFSVSALRAAATGPGPAGVGEPLQAEASLAGEFAEARDAAKTAEAARGALAKLGDTRWELGRFEIENPENRFVPVSRLNDLRRDLAAAMDRAWAAACAARRTRILASEKAPTLFPNVGKCDDAFSERWKAGSGETWAVKVDDPGVLAEFESADWSDVSDAIVDISVRPMKDLEAGLARLATVLGRERVRLALPPITRAWERTELQARIRTLLAGGWKRWLAANVSALAVLPATGLDLAADWPLYAMNAAAIRELAAAGFRGFTFSPEDGLPNLRELLRRHGGAGSVIVYQDTPLFVSEVCVRLSSSGKCPGVGRCDFEEDRLMSSHGDRVRAVNRKCRTWLVGERPLCWVGHLDELRAAGARSFRADFAIRHYAPAEARSIWSGLRQGRAPAGAAAGNLHRGLA